MKNASMHMTMLNTNVHLCIRSMHELRRQLICVKQTQYFYRTDALHNSTDSVKKALQTKKKNCFKSSSQNYMTAASKCRDNEDTTSHI